MMGKLDGDYESKWKSDREALHRFDDLVENGEEPDTQNPRYQLAPAYFEDYLANRPSDRASRSLKLALRLWGDISGVSSDVRRAVTQIADDEEFDEDVWETLASSICHAFWKDGLFTEPLEVVDELARRISSLCGKGILLARNGVQWTQKDNIKRAKRNFHKIQGFDTSDCPWWVEPTATGFLYEFEHLNIGQPAPHFAVKDIDGQSVDLADYRGRVVLLDFWSSTCGPCHGEFPFLRALSTRYSADRFAIIGVSLDESIESLRECRKTENLSWPQICEEKIWWDMLAKLFNIHGIPTTYILDEEGRILAKNKRRVDIQETLDSVLQPLKDNVS